MQLYIHIPFCEKKCSYCRFASIGSTQEFLIEKYVRYLCKEIDTSKNITGEIETLYFGGGTPGVLSPDQLNVIFDSLSRKYIFSKNIEITLETTPNHVTGENLKVWKKLGINRISMGIQTLNEKSLGEIGRGGKGDIEKALEALKGGVILNISVDFIIGLPHVAKGEILEDIKYTLKKYRFITHISVYMLEDYYNEDKIIETSYDKKIYPDGWELEGLLEEDYLQEYSSIRDYLENQGFGRYEISNFSKAGYECRHNKGYWSHSEIRAFGLAAYGFESNKRYANSESFVEYYKGVKIIEEGVTDKELFTEKVMFGLRTSGIENTIHEKLNQKKLQEFLDEGFLEKKSDRVILSDKGVMVMDYILSELV